MTIEYGGGQKPLEERIKSKIAMWTGLPKAEDLPINNNIAQGNIIASRPFFEKEAETVYSFVDTVASVARRLRLVKK